MADNRKSMGFTKGSSGKKKPRCRKMWKAQEMETILAKASRCTPEQQWMIAELAKERSEYELMVFHVELSKLYGINSWAGPKFESYKAATQRLTRKQASTLIAMLKNQEG